MTIKELYEWAIEHNVLDYDITVLGSDGCLTQVYKAEIHNNTHEVEL